MKLSLSDHYTPIITCKSIIFNLKKPLPELKEIVAVSKLSPDWDEYPFLKAAARKLSIKQRPTGARFMRYFLGRCKKD